MLRTDGEACGMTLTLELDPVTRAALERLAAERGRSVEDLAREALARLASEAAPQRRSAFGLLRHLGPVPSLDELRRGRMEAWRGIDSGEALV
jgi:plasmid stability protein